LKFHNFQNKNEKFEKAQIQTSLKQQMKKKQNVQNLKILLFFSGTQFCPKGLGSLLGHIEVV
jgi:acyl-CoA synthetase (AMP-forming)/AMP-acid ligase II